MKRKAIWFIVSFLIITSLVLASCAPVTAPTTTTPTGTAPATTTATATAAPTVAPSPDKPQYGGTLILGIRSEDVTDGFDQLLLGSAAWYIPMTIQYDELMTGDWAMGAAGTGQVGFKTTNFANEGIFNETGALAESWSIPDDQTLIFKIRRGVHWWNKPPVNGRELKADDIVFTFKRFYLNPLKPVTHGTQSAPAGQKLTDVFVDPNDPWTVVIKVSGKSAIFQEDIMDKVWIVPKESVEKYGDLTRWENALGTGAFMLTDYVPGSSVTMVRNPDWWMKNPVGPGKGDQLPYLDGLKFLVLADEAARNAALRTGKVDHLSLLDWEDADSFKKTTPDLIVERKGSSGDLIRIHTESTSPLAAPLMKQRVRQALSMAIDRQSIVDDYYGGNAAYLEFLAFEGAPIFTPIDQMPKILEESHGFKPEDAKMVQTMMEYHPDIAKKILAEEGYPNGFKTKIIIGAAPEDPDEAAIVKDMWKRNLNVDLELDIRERAVYRSATDRRDYEAMVWRNGTMAGWAERFNYWGPSEYEGPRGTSNITNFRDKYASEWMLKSDAVYGDIEARSKIIKQFAPWLLQTGWFIPFPAPYSFNAWWPWLKNYHGEDSIGYRNVFNWTRYVWYDKDLRKTMGR